MKLMRKIKNNLSMKYLITSSSIFGISIIAINLASLQLNETVLDFRLGYSTETVYSFFDKIGHSGRSLYTILLQIDFIFPIVYMVFGVCAISMVLKKYKNTDSILDVLLFFPGIAMICDWIENSLLLKMLTNYGKSTIDLGTLAATMTALKLILLFFFRNAVGSIFTTIFEKASCTSAMILVDFLLIRLWSKRFCCNVLL